MKITLADSAVADLQDIIDYYAADDIPEVGRQQVTKILASVKVLADHPRIGRVVPEFEDEAIREIIKKPYRIVYWHQSNTCKIIRVWRSERRLQLPDN